MTVLKINPFNDLNILTKSLNRIYSEMPDNNLFKETLFPKIDISEDEKKVYFEVELPGFNKNDINIKLENNVLTVKGEQINKDLNKTKLFIRKERVFGSFNRSFSLEEEINPDAVTAEYKDGILTITLEKVLQKASGKRQITVK